MQANYFGKSNGSRAEALFLLRVASTPNCVNGLPIRFYFFAPAKKGPRRPAINDSLMAGWFPD
jgi:hypothetical protein